MILFIATIFLVFLAIGSFFNVVAYRVAFNKPFFTQRSFCPSCAHTIAWYDNIPLLSWFLLRGRCRGCQGLISFLYPSIETVTACIMTGLFFKIFSFSFWNVYQVESSWWLIGTFLIYMIAFSALIISARTDLEAMVVPQIFSIWLVPVGIASSFFGLTMVSIWMSLLGTILGYGSLWLIGKLFFLMSSQEGIGVGDMELLAMIGSFFGPCAVLFSLMIGSMTGLLIAGCYLWLTGKGRGTRIPFAPFLALGTVIFFFFRETFCTAFF